MIPLALIVLLASVALYFALPHKVEAVGITGAWDPDDVGTVFVIDGNDYIVESDENYTGKYITYNEAKYYVIENAADFNLVTNGTEVTDIQVNAIITNDFTITDRTSTIDGYGINLEGNNKTITLGDGCTVGLYNNFSGFVKNLNLAGSYTIENAHTGAFACWAKSGVEFTNVHSSVSIDATQNSGSSNIYVGGLIACGQIGSKAMAGLSDASYKIIFTDCSFTGSIEIQNHGGYAGGLAGGLQANGKFTNCSNSGNLTERTPSATSKNSSRSLGGMVGVINNKSTLTSFNNCQNSGKLTSIYKACGGMVGYNQSTTLTLTDCTNTGKIQNASPDTKNGGMVGQAAGTTINITNCNNTADIEGTGSSTGGLAGYCGATINISESSNTGKISSTGGTAGGVIGKSNGAVTMSDTVNNGSVTAKSGNNAGDTAVGGIVGCFRNAKTHSFTNVVNNGNVSITQMSGWAGGFIGSISDVGATITLTNCAVNGDVSTSGALGSFAYGTVGGFVGGSYNQSGTNGLISITIKDSVCTGDVTANGTVLNYAGGYVGYLGHGSADAQITVQDSAFVGTVTNASTDENAKTAAFIGYTNKDFTITRSFSYATLEGSSNYALAFADGAAASVSNAIVNSNAAATLNNGDATLKSPAAFAAGEVAYLLNTAKGSTVWYQTIGTDAAPVMNNTHGTVYQVNLKTPGDKIIGKTYSNTEGVDVLFSMTTAAEKRTEPNGIRWITAMDDYHMEVLKAAFMAGTANLEGAGTLIAPAPFVTAAGGLTHAELVAWLESKGFTASDLDEISFDIPGMDGWYNGQEGTFAGSVANIREENKVLTYLGVGYLVVDGEYVYASAPVPFACAD